MLLFGKKKSLCRRADEVADAVVVTLIFNKAAVEKSESTLLPRHRWREGGDKGLFGTRKFFPIPAFFL